ncbi:MAG TPA: hypothetical protein VGK16_02595 [Candidatus Limnocylindrales bacterium]
MTRNRTAGAALVLVSVVVAACGGASTPAATTAADAPATVDAGTGSTETEAPSATEAAPATGEAAGDAGTAADDAAKLGGQLVPPNSKELSKTTTDTYWYVVYDSTDSPDTLKGFYEAQIPKAGMQIISTTSANGSYSWAIARDASGGFGGAVTVGPSGSGSGSSVIIAVGS